MSPTSPRQPGAGAAVARHATFKLHRDSHSMHKAANSSPPSSSSTTSSVSSSSSNAIITSSSSHRPASAPAPAPPPRQKQQQQQPVIIYTHSPKVIRTNPRDFMSIVQKLTGLDSPAGPGRGAPQAGPRINTGSVAVATGTAQDESSSSSSESCANTHTVGPPPYADSQLMPPPPPAPPLDAHFMAPDVPLLFAPDADLQQLCAPRGLYGQFSPVDAAAALGPVMSSTNMNSVASNGGGAVFFPSMVETVRTFPSYN